ncbi:GcrA family cell cycle regulator [Roseovarius sp. D22-M7]|uniref:GcrA family cell cycle regulator n=1 Tax=Roseovarius sp. D22-M7 TaxID=3127116 RepID=UPI0030101C32
MAWNDERVDLLKRMWSEGQSASQIAKELGGVTRNAVIGKVHRLGLSNRTGAGVIAAEVEVVQVETDAPDEAEADAPAEPTAPPGPDPVAEHAAAEMDDAEAAPAQANITRVRTIVPAGQPLPPQPSANEIDPEALAKVSEIEKKAKKLSLMELTERTCKWPVGDPATSDFWFCGLPVQSGKPYCEAHVGVAFQPVSGRRDRKR